VKAASKTSSPEPSKDATKASPSLVAVSGPPPKSSVPSKVPPRTSRSSGPNVLQALD
jgi:hypothetical protein